MKIRTSSVPSDCDRVPIEFPRHEINPCNFYTDTRFTNTQEALERHLSRSFGKKLEPLRLSAKS